MNQYFELLTTLINMSKTDRLLRLIKLSVDESTLDAKEMLEFSMIQSIRTENGEIEEVLKNRVGE